MLVDWLLPACTLFVFSVLIAILALLVQGQTKQAQAIGVGQLHDPTQTATTLHLRRHVEPVAGPDQGSAADFGDTPAAKAPHD